ncbi:sodium:proton antiporter [Nitrogeniibacter mangrovi]|uniref:Sodium:proton antiporter n=1 Tax=Nitrogeniibacter mangrovi TaxID=2016596 RepID=A0A6C1B5G5_9RHOO|nr:cation:proton antiporter [Nitrogeniibacter mangrovi]QID17474.1 sodium:proton antiporter [Nitrogeniibacter mangrovi]
MDATGWYLLVGTVLFSMGLLAARISGMAMTSAMFYLAVGVLIGPTAFGLFHFNPLKSAAWLEVITEIAVLVSLYACGLKLKVPLRSRLWHIPLRLATISMGVGIALVAGFAHFALGMSWGAAILIGALLAPTDPVLATDVQVRHPGDNDRLRFGLTAEAGLNDGTAFPFVMLGLGLLGVHDIGGGGRWLALDVVWASVAGVALGAALGSGVARLVFALRRQRRETVFMDDFIGLGLIALTNGLALAISAYAFLAVFAAAVALRQTEQHLMARHRDELPVSVARASSLAERSMHFNEQLERIGEVVLLLLLGGSLFANSWTWEAVMVAAFVFFVARPVGVYVGLTGVDLPGRTRHYMAWFGVRGIGSLYYLMYAIVHGLDKVIALQILSITLIVVTLSIIVHGVSVRPLMRRYAPPA